MSTDWAEAGYVAVPFGPADKFTIRHQRPSGAALLTYPQHQHWNENGDLPHNPRQLQANQDVSKPALFKFGKFEDPDQHYPLPLCQ